MAPVTIPLLQRAADTWEHLRVAFENSSSPQPPSSTNEKALHIMHTLRALARLPWVVHTSLIHNGVLSTDRHGRSKDFDCAQGTCCAATDSASRADMGITHRHSSARRLHGAAHWEHPKAAHRQDQALDTANDAFVADEAPEHGHQDPSLARAAAQNESSTHSHGLCPSKVAL